MSTETREAAMSATKDLGEMAGKYLTFLLGDEEYGIEILKVQEIIGMMSVTTVPRTPEFVRGVINLRGKVIPVVELRLKFGMETCEDTERTCIIVVQVAGEGVDVTMGIIVDQVSEVLEISSEEIEPPPSFGTDIDTDFILAVGKIANRVVMLLDVDKVLSSGELAVIEQAGQ